MGEIAASAVVAVDRYETGERTIDALRRQTLAGRLEVVVVGPDLVVPTGADDGLGALVAIEVPVHPLSAARSAGILAARGRAVYVAETHGYPRPECLERLLEAIDDGAGAAMPRFANANPGSARSHASLFATYGAFTGDRPRGLDQVALHNGMFERELLATVAQRPADLVYGVGLTEALVRAGSTMRFVPEAEVEHLNVSRPQGIVTDRLVGGRLWAGIRSRSWSGRRRAAHVAAAPLAPVVMARRIFGSDGWRGRGEDVPRGTAPLIVAYSALQTFGEMAGYARGVGDAERRHIHLELHREAYL